MFRKQCLTSQAAGKIDSLDATPPCTHTLRGRCKATGEYPFPPPPSPHTQMCKPVTIMSPQRRTQAPSQTAIHPHTRQRTHVHTCTHIYILCRQHGVRPTIAHGATCEHITVKKGEVDRRVQSARYHPHLRQRLPHDGVLCPPLHADRATHVDTRLLPTRGCPWWAGR